MSRWLKVAPTIALLAICLVSFQNCAPVSFSPATEIRTSKTESSSTGASDLIEAEDQETDPMDVGAEQEPPENQPPVAIEPAPIPKQIDPPVKKQPPVAVEPPPPTTPPTPPKQIDPPPKKQPPIAVEPPPVPKRDDSHESKHSEHKDEPKHHPPPPPVADVPAPIIFPATVGCSGYTFNRVKFVFPKYAKEEKETQGKPDVHFLSVYESLGGKHADPRNAGATRVMVSSGNKPVVLHLNNYEATRWVIVDPSSRVKDITLGSYYESSVTVNGVAKSVGNQTSASRLMYTSLAAAGGSEGGSDELYARGMQVHYRPKFRIERFAEELSARIGRKVTHLQSTYIGGCKDMVID